MIRATVEQAAYAMIGEMKIYVFLILMVGVSLTGHAEPVSNTILTGIGGKTYTLDAALWARPRSGQSVVALPPVRDAVRQLLNQPGSQLAIRYPGGEEGSLWAEEIRDWLVALGLEPQLLIMQPGLAHDDRIELQVVQSLK
jgi:hypothetical protein